MSSGNRTRSDKHVATHISDAHPQSVLYPRVSQHSGLDDEEVVATTSFGAFAVTEPSTAVASIQTSCDPAVELSHDPGLQQYFAYLTREENDNDDTEWWDRCCAGEDPRLQCWEFPGILGAQDEAFETCGPMASESGGASSGASEENRTGERDRSNVERDLVQDQQRLSKKLKSDIRKERNRASAQRCNRRKKAIRDSLKLQLKSYGERVTELRAQEMELRRQNLRLRKMLKAKS